MPSPIVVPGLDVLASGQDSLIPFLKSKNCALLSNPTGVTREGKSALETLRALEIPVIRLFSPEHGPRADKEGDIADSQLENLPNFSLYGATRRPTPQMLDGLEVIICDLQDVGARFYTYAATIFHVLEEALPRNIEVVILDRPNPLGGAIEGPIVEPELRSFIGYAPFPITHGLTMGEMARFFVRWKNLDETRLKIGEIRGWKRAMNWIETGLEWRQPSPNLPNFNSAAWYPGLSLLEFSGVSVGRGTDAPFQILAAPWLDSQKFLENWLQMPETDDFQTEFLEVVPTRATFEGEKCRAVRFSNSEGAPKNPVAFGLQVMATLRQTHPDFSRELWNKSAQLVGSRAVLDAIWDGKIETALEIARRDAQKFRIERESVLIYD